MAEFDVLGKLWSMGLPVPYPVQLDGLELLMEFVGADGQAAPRLAQSRPEQDLLPELFDQVRDTMTRLALHGWAHGDLSPYNVLLHGERLVFIAGRRSSTSSATRTGRSSSNATPTTCATGSSDGGSRSTRASCSATSWRRPHPAGEGGGGRTRHTGSSGVLDRPVGRVVAYARRVTEATPPGSATEPATQPPRLTNVTALVGEAMTKSGVIWVEIPGDRAWPVWHAWVAPTAYVVNGPGEQHLPWLPEEVVVVLRSQDTGGRLLRVRARRPGCSPSRPVTRRAWVGRDDSAAQAGPPQRRQGRRSSAGGSSAPSRR